MSEQAPETVVQETPPAFRPTRESKRIETLDVARGFALLGIFMVNIQLMAQPMGWYMGGGGSNEGGLGAAVYYATKVLFESKSYPLFSMLFGMGLVLMHSRAKAAGRSFVAPYLRRLVMLLAMGLCHAWFLWFGDVLAIYAGVAIAVMWLVKFSARTMLILAVSLVLAAVLWTTAIPLVVWGLGVTQPEPPTETSVTTFQGFIEAMKAGEVTAGLMDPAWAAAETDAFKNGPFLHAFMMRGINWGSMLVFWTIFSAAGLHIAGMFLLGGAMMKAGVVTDERPVWARRLMALGLLIGLPGAVLVVWLQSQGQMGSLVYSLSAPLLMAVGPFVSLGYFGLAKWLAQNLGDALPVRMVAAAGRMALTNYLGQSLLVAILVQHWGFAWHSDVKQSQMIFIVAAIYLAQLIISPLWLSRFTMGPLEWLWRWWTYLRPPRLIRRAAGD